MAVAGSLDKDDPVCPKGSATRRERRTGMSKRKAVRIEVEYDDGLLERAEGEDAAQIWKAIEAGFVFKHIHGMPYLGPQMKTIVPAQERQP